jgi:hypothetical protein
MTELTTSEKVWPHNSLYIKHQIQQKKQTLSQSERRSFSFRCPHFNVIELAAVSSSTSVQGKLSLNFDIAKLPDYSHQQPQPKCFTLLIHAIRDPHTYNEE